MKKFLPLICLGAISAAFAAVPDLITKELETIPESALRAQPAQMRKFGAPRVVMPAPEGGYALPVTFGPGNIDECLIVDVNQDSKTWAASSLDGISYLCYTYSGINPADDWCFLPGFKAEAEGTYKIQLTYRVRSATYPECFKVFLGQGQAIDAATHEIASYDEVSNTAEITDTYTVDLAAGEWNIGLYACSKKNMYGMYVRDITVSRIDGRAPAAPVVTVDAEGYNCNIDVTLPSNNLAGEPLAGEVTASMFFDGAPVDADGTLTGLPGETVAFHFTSPSGGPHTFGVTASVNCDGETVTSEMVSVDKVLTAVMPYPLPLGTEIIPTFDQFYWCRIINANNDNKTIYLADNGFNAYEGGDNVFAYSYSSSNPADEWLLFPVYEGGSNGARKLSFNVSTRSYPERVEACFAYEDQVNALDPESDTYAADLAALFAPNTIYADYELKTSQEWQRVEKLFSAESGRNIVVAIHICSQADKGFVFIHGVRLESADGTAPCPAVWGDPDFDGGDGSINLTLPSLTRDNQPVTGTVYADIKLDGEPYGEPVSGQPGETVTVSFSGLSLGSHAVTALAYTNEDGTRRDSEEVTTQFQITIGSNFAYELPLDLVLTQDIFDFFTTINANGDDKVWCYEDNAFCLPYNGDMASDDWLITPAINIPDVSGSFDFEALLRGKSTSYPEAFEIFIGTAPTVEAMTTLLTGDEELTSTEYVPYNANFSLDAPGKYYIGIHGKSEADKFGLLVSKISFKVSTTSAEGPSAVRNLTGDGLETGALVAKIEFNFPTENLIGGALDPAETLTATVTSDSAVETVEGLPGSAASVEIAAPQGWSTVKVMPSNSYGTGEGSTVQVRCGLDVPTNPVITGVETSEDNMSATVTWNPVTTGVGGNHVNTTKMGYIIFEYDEEDEDWYQIDAIDGTAFTYQLDSPDQPQNLFLIGVMATNGFNSSSSISTTSLFLGKPLALPVSDDFAGGDFNAGVVTLSSSLPTDYAPEWMLKSPGELIEGVISPSNCVMAGHTYFNRGDSNIGLPRFSTENIDREVEISFTNYSFPECGEYTVVAFTRENPEPVSLGVFTAPSTTEGWKVNTVTLPESMMGKKWVDVQIKVDFVNGSSTVPMIDSYTFREKEGSGIGAGMLSGAAVLGGTGEITFLNCSGVGITVSRIDGVTVADETVESDVYSIAVQSGAYAVTYGDKRTKVFVK